MIYYFKLRKHGIVVSSLVFYTVKLPSRNLGVIEEVKTLKKYRKQGLATKNILKALKKAKDLKLNCVELTVRQDKPQIQEFYKKLGFYDRLNLAYRYEL